MDLLQEATRIGLTHLLIDQDNKSIKDEGYSDGRSDGIK